jgi:putative phosphoesterase
MKIGVISDTHLDAPTPLLESTIHNYFKDTDLILHAGDLHSPEVLNAFEGKRVYVVAGNCDGAKVKERFPLTRVITVKGFRIGLTHGWGPPFGLEKRAATAFEDVHCLVFGHSHWAVNHRRNNVLFFNPGAFKGGAFSLWRRSVGLLTLGRDIKGEIIWL